MRTFISNIIYLKLLIYLILINNFIIFQIINRINIFYNNLTSNTSNSSILNLDSPPEIS